MVDEQLALPVTADANDFIYQWDASHDYDPSAGMEKIEATLLAINAADDERNPPETGVTAAAVKRIKNGKIYLIPASTRDARPSHHRQCEVLCRAGQGAAADRAAEDDVRQRSAMSRAGSARSRSACPRRSKARIRATPIFASASASLRRSAIPMSPGAW